MNLVYKNENALFGISLVISLLFWLAIVVGTFGLVLLYFLAGLVAYAFIQSAFISYIKGTAVRVTPEQFPDLHAQLLHCCNAVGVKEPPEMYLLHADGAFNAFATRFFGHHFIALFSDVVDALDGHKEAINFYIGHELGHIARGHLSWGPVLWPASVLPLLGPAYSRAREYTCDNYGRACCNDVKDAELALAALAAGGSRWKTLNVPAYAGQSAATGGFWMAFHELVSDYPWLVKRMARVRGDATQTIPTRNPFAWLLALFVPRTGAGAGAAGVLVVLLIIGILAAVAVPAYQEYKDKADVAPLIQQGYEDARPFQEAVETYAFQNEEFPESNDDLEGLLPDVPATLASVEIQPAGVIVLTYGDNAGSHAGKTLIVEAMVADGEFRWECTGGDMPQSVRPLDCRE